MLTSDEMGVWGNLEQIESLSWTKPWTRLACILVLQIMSFPWCAFVFVGLNQLIFPPKKVPCSFCLDLPLFGLGPSSKGRGSNLGFLASRIALFHWTLDLGLSSKVTINLILGCNIFSILEWKISSGFWLVLAVGGGGRVQIFILFFLRNMASFFENFQKQILCRGHNGGFFFGSLVDEILP